MSSRNGHDEILNAPPETRKGVSGSLYDQEYESRFKDRGEVRPTKRRRKRIAIYHKTAA
jgi:hypothetical protein